MYVCSFKEKCCDFFIQKQKTQLFVLHFCNSKPLKERYDEICKFCDTTENLLQKYSDMSIDDWGATSTTPAVKDMDDWLQNIRLLLFDQYPFCVNVFIWLSV
jgi:hypothetical protein